VVEWKDFKRGLLEN